jgi:dipeptidyl aminopeptidase/acylaminoacyl peptidase
MSARRCSRAVALLAALSWAAAPGAGELPVEYFFKDYAVSNVKISPDGKSLAMVRHDGTNFYLVSVDLGSLRSQVVCSGNVRDYMWVSDERLVVEGGGEHSGGMFGVNRDGRKRKVLLMATSAQVTDWYCDGRPRSWVRFYDVLEHSRKDFPFILVSSEDMNLWPFSQSFEKPEVRRVNVLTGHSEVAAPNPGDVVQWFTDRHGQVRLALAIRKETARLLHRASREQPWEAVLEGKLLAEDIMPIGFAPDNRRFYVASRAGQNTLGLYLFDPATGRLGDCLWRHERYDLCGVRYTAAKADVGGVLYEAERLECHWFDATNRALAARLDKALPGLVKRPIGESEDGSKTLYFAYSDRTPGAYYLLHSDRNKLDRIAEVASWIKLEDMAEMRPITYPTRDSLQVHGYLTLPKGREARQLPLILMPHGGPWVRDSWAFDGRVQFLANRGYAVLQPNYRSSTGYGLAFIEAGYKQHGLKIQDDLADGAAWAVREGIADPKRIAIFGTSYGGYAALIALSQTPELYRCGIIYAGLTDLSRQLRYFAGRAPQMAQAFPEMRTGDNRTDKDLLPEVSPASLIPKIQAPVMLIYGGEDYVVPADQSRRLERTFSANGKICEFICERSEPHVFTTPTNVFKLYNRIEVFLRKHLQ